MRLIVAKTPLYMVACGPSPVAVHICGFHVCATHCSVEPFSALFAVVETYASCNHVAQMLFLGLYFAWPLYAAIPAVGICTVVPALGLQILFASFLCGSLVGAFFENASRQCELHGSDKITSC